MEIKHIPYFIYTSGEEGLSGLDWGVKFASSGLDKSKLQKEYEKIGQDYWLSIKDDRPSELGILVLNKFLSYVIIGFVFPSHDSSSQGSRDNITLIGCLVSDELKSEHKLFDVVNALYNSNDLKEIACLDKEKIKDVKRPDYLKLDFEKFNSEDNGLLRSLSTARNDELIQKEFDKDGYWIKDNNIKELKLIVKTEKKENQIQSNNEKENKPKGGKTLKITLIAFVIILLTIIISSTIASYFIGMINRISPDKPIEKVEKTKPRTNLVDEIANRITNNIINCYNIYNRNNEKLVGFAFLKKYIGDKCELEIGGEFSDSNLNNLTSFSIKRDFECDIICTENDLRNSIKTFFANCKEFNKMPRDNFFKAYFDKKPSELLAENLKVKFNKDLSNKNQSLKSLDDIRIKNYLLKYLNSFNKKDLDNLKNKFSEQNRIYMPDNFTKYILVLNSRSYFYRVIELDASFNTRDIGEFFYTKEQNLRFFKLPVVSIDDSKNFYIKKDGNYYRFGKVVVSGNKEEALEEFSRKYFEFIKEKNK